MKSYLLILMFLISGCAINQPDEYQIWSTKPTPNIWDKNLVWGMILLDRKGSIVRNITLQFTQEKAEVCVDGDYKKIDILSEYPRRSVHFMGKAGYIVKGSAIIIDLSANLCDAYYELRGKLTEIGIEGYHQPVTAFNGEEVVRFYGLPVSDLE